MLRCLRRVIVAVACSLPVSAGPALAQIAKDPSELANTLWASRPEGPFGPELSGTGLRLGMDLGDAESLVRARIDVAATIVRTGTRRIGADPLQVTVFSTADGRDGFGLLGHPALAGRVVGVARATLIDPAVLSWQQVSSALHSVYGESISFGSSHADAWIDTTLGLENDHNFTVHCAGNHWPTTLPGVDAYDEVEFAELRKSTWVEVYNLSDPPSFLWPSGSDLAREWLCPTTIFATSKTVGDDWRLTISIYDTAWVTDAATRARLGGSAEGEALLSKLLRVDEGAPSSEGAQVLEDLLGVGASAGAPSPAEPLHEAKSHYGQGRYDDAAELLLPIAEGGNAEAVGLLAEMVSDGLIEAGPGYYVVERLARYAADAGDVRGLYYHARTTQVDTPDDASVVLDLLSRSAETGYVRAQAYLAEAYHKGSVMPQDASKALLWAERAGDQGDAASQVLAGVLYRDGLGTAVDLAAAAAWIGRAAAQGYPNANRELEEVTDEIAAIEERRVREEEAVRRRAEQEVLEAEEKRRAELDPESATGEPSDPEMRAAIQDYLNGVNSGMDSTMAACERGAYQNDPVLAIQCLAMMATTGTSDFGMSPTVDIARFQKLGCAESDNQPGYVCDYVLGLNSSGAMGTGVLGQMMSTGSATQGRFLPQSGGWLFLPLD
jgi:TPR repeat protein